MIESGSLVTVAGFGGTGKTRLAEELAIALAEAGGPTVVFVELAAMRDDSTSGSTS
jgi:KaiC/GvpD/RAD55 family RecA-like ATPase